jgi:hypothetical protein
LRSLLSNFNLAALLPPPEGRFFMRNARLLAVVLLSSSIACNGSKSSSGTGGSEGSGTAGTSGQGSAGTSGGTAGTSGGTAGTSGGTAGTTGGTAGTTGAAGSSMSTAGTTGTAGTTAAGGRGGSTGTAGTTAAGGRGGASGTTGGTAGTTGTGGMSCAATVPADTSNSVLERNKHPSRDGNFLQPTLTKAMVMSRMAFDSTFNATFAGASGNVWNSPLYVENGPGGKGVFIVATQDNNVFALDETTGAQVWMKNIGAPATASIGCSGIPGPTPLGIISTPVIDATSGTIYVAGSLGTSSGISENIVTALSITDGSPKSGWPVHVSTMLSFDPKLHIQRSALSLVGGVLYVGYGGFVGDCGNYRGRVVAIKASDPTQVVGWATGGHGEGIWDAGGFASNGTDIFAVTGNFTSGTPARTDSEEVVRLTGMATVTKSDTKNFWYPSTFASMDSNDADLGANSPVYLQIPCATPSNILAALSKDGHLFLLNADNLGGTATAPVDYVVASGAMSIHTVPAAYSTNNGVRYTFSTDGGATGCPGGTGGRVVMSVAIPGGAPPKPQTLWCQTITGGPASPIATTTDGKSDALVWIMSGSSMNAFDGDTGTSVYKSGGSDCANVPRWTSPIAVKGRIVVAATGKLCSWSLH